MVSAVGQAKRALVALLRTLAAAYACAVRVTRDSEDAEVRTAYRAVSRKVHPDRPTGCAADQKRLNAAHEKCQIREASLATPDYEALDARRAAPEIPLRDPRWRRIIIHRSLTSHSTPRIIRHDRNRARASTLYIHRHGRSLRPRTAALPATSGPRWCLRWTRRMASPATPDYRGLDARRAVPEIPLRRYKSSSRFMRASRWYGFRMSLPRERAGRG